MNIMTAGTDANVILASAVWFVHVMQAEMQGQRQEIGNT